MNELQIFKNDDFSVRAIEDNGEIWFVAKDVARALGYSETSIKQITALTQSVPGIWKGRKPFSTLGGEQEMLCLSEQGLYFFLGRSDKKAALPYQMWIAGEVVPSIRKTGSYGRNLELDIRAAEVLQKISTSSQEERERIDHEVFKLITGKELSKIVWTAEEIGEELGWTSDVVIYRAQKLEIMKRAKNGYWDNGIWFFNKEGRRRFLELVRKKIVKIEDGFAVYEDGHRFINWVFDPDEYHETRI